MTGNKAQVPWLSRMGPKGETPLSNWMPFNPIAQGWFLYCVCVCFPPPPTSLLYLASSKVIFSNLLLVLVLSTVEGLFDY
jgi:hypothetical protein